MPIPILMPALSPTMVEGNLVRWLKNEGDSIRSGEVIAEIETDKATMEIEASDDGILGKILVPAGTENVKVREHIALLLEKGEDPSVLENFAPVTHKIQEVKSEPIVSIEPQPIEVISSRPRIADERIVASPLAKRVARENNIDLAAIKGTGSRGRILEADVLHAQRHPAKEKTSGGGYREVPFNNVRKVIAKKLTEAKQQIPHFYLTIDCYLDALLQLRSETNQHIQEKVSINDFIIKAGALSLIKVPEANATGHDNAVRYYDTADVAVAVAVEGGLFTPIIRQAETKSVQDISREMRELANRARSGKLTPEEYLGGAFTISNLGMFGIKQFEAIINPPQASILAVGAGEKRPFIQSDGSLKVGTFMTCTLSVDHRILDGAISSKFLAAFKEMIENPQQLL